MSASSDFFFVSFPFLPWIPTGYEQSLPTLRQHSDRRSAKPGWGHRAFNHWGKGLLSWEHSRQALLLALLVSKRCTISSSHSTSCTCSSSPATACHQRSFLPWLIGSSLAYGSSVLHYFSNIAAGGCRQPRAASFNTLLSLFRLEKPFFPPMLSAGCRWGRKGWQKQGTAVTPNSTVATPM